MALPLDQLVRRLVESGLLTAADVQAFVESLPEEQRPQDSQQLARLLVKAKQLSAYQAQEVYKGAGKGLVLGNYVILDKLGQGGMGMVLKAQHTRMQRVVALKVLSPKVTQDEATVQRFHREVVAAARLMHPNIVAALDADDAKGTHFLVMEYVEGRDLSVVVKERGPLPVEKALHCILQAARGLEYAHQEGVIHRDIKPANLLLDNKGTVKILDMGLARFDASAAGAGQADLTGTGQIMGTVDYMAPEQAMNTKRADQRADIYSLGISLWYLVTGRAAYDGETLMEKLMGHQTKPIPSLREACPQVSAALEAVFTKMVAKTPEARYQNMTEVIADIQRCVTDEAAAPSLVSAPGEDSRLSDFLRGMEFTRPSGMLTKAAPKKTGVAPAAEATIVGQSAQVDTDPYTEQPLPRIAGEKPTLTRSASEAVRGFLSWLATSPRLRIGLVSAVGGAVVLLLAVIVVFALTRPGKAPSALANAGSKMPGDAGASASWHGWPKDAPPPAIAPFDAATAKKHQETWAKHLGVPVEYTNSFGMKFVLIPPGEFMMGSTAAEIEEILKNGGEEYVKSEAPTHKVILTQPIYLGVHEVTQVEYEKVAGKNPSEFAPLGAAKDTVAGVDTSTHPVEGVSWNDAAEFCATLSSREKLTPFYSRSGETVTMLEGIGYRLPTEAQWEFACRGGTRTRYWIGDKDEELTQAAWFNMNALSRTQKVGELKANPLGLHDIHGNVWEWVQDAWEPDYYAQFQERSALDPRGPSPAGSLRVIRGGGQYHGPRYCRTSCRFALDATNRSNGPTGIRLALTVDAVKAAIAKGRTKSATSIALWHGWPKDAPPPAIAPFDAKQARAHQEAWAKHLGVPVEYTNTIGMRFVLIPPGEFTMGSTPEEIERAGKIASFDTHWTECVKSEAPQHTVALTSPVYIGVYSVTQAQYQKVVGKNPSFFAAAGPEKLLADKVAGMDTSRFPVEGTSWNDAAEFCARLSELDRLPPSYMLSGGNVTLLPGNGYRLPTEAEWEFSCRAGTTTQFWTGDDERNLGDAGWFDTSSSGRTHSVGELKPNPFGLYDVHGNLWEWVQDWWEPTYYGELQSKPTVNPTGPAAAGAMRVFRGSSWFYPASACRSSSRYADVPTTRSSSIGFRVLLSVDPVKVAIAQGMTKSASSIAAWQGWPKDAPPPAIAPFDAKQARAHQETWAKYLKVPVEYTDTIGVKFVLIPPGEFLMGSSKTEVDAVIAADPSVAWAKSWLESETPPRRLEIKKPFYLGLNEVTVGEFRQFAAAMNYKSVAERMGGGAHYSVAKKGIEIKPEYFWNAADVATADNLPAHFLGPEDALAFHKWLNAKTGIQYSLPSEAQWEFACRAGTTTQFFFGADETDAGKYAWVLPSGKIHPVGLKLANPFGLLDICGNVQEWALDPMGKGFLRGGDRNATPALYRSAMRRPMEDRPWEGWGFRSLADVDSVRQQLAALYQLLPDAPPQAIAPFEAAQARKHQEAWAKHVKVPVEYTNTIGMKFVLIPPGEFMMGSMPAEIEEALKSAGDVGKRFQDYIKSEAPQHKVILTQPIYFGVNKVTQAEYERVMGTNPSCLAKTGSYAYVVAGLDTAGHPVEFVSWNDAAEFCAKLSEQEKLKSYYLRTGETVAIPEGTGYRLPTEAQWEFACRAGTTTRYWIGDKDEDLPPAAWFNKNSGSRTHKVGELKGNPFGLYDIHGNVLEWVQDWWEPTYYGQFQEKPAQDPRGPLSAGSERIIRGGYFNSDAPFCRDSYRGAHAPANREYIIGFRVAMPVDAVRAAIEERKRQGRAGPRSPR